ncbi:MAG TPA: hypothetical protein VFL95_01810 [Gemmatimonadales bacterium]|nr:hypothetical protein [Gemmatimonadales bacterium]
MLPDAKPRPRRHRRRMGARVFGIVGVVAAAIPVVLQAVGRRPPELPPVSIWPVLAGLLGLILAWRWERVGGAVLAVVGIGWMIAMYHASIPEFPAAWVAPVLLFGAGCLFVWVGRPH